MNLLKAKTKEEIIADVNKLRQERLFKAGDICFWNGNRPAIVRIKHTPEDLTVAWLEGKRAKPYPDCYAAVNKKKDYNCLSEQWLSLATDEQIKLLGNKEIHII